MFKEQIIGTEFAYLGLNSKEEVRKVFRTNRKIRRKIELQIFLENFLFVCQNLLEMRSKN